MTRLLPTPRQLEYQRWERGLFLHFGLRTFYEGWRDMDPRPMDPQRFEPSALDCDQWARTCKAAGFNYMVMTAKHHDGFALWPSKTTDFSVANAPWRDGQGDVVAEFIAACRRRDLGCGLYYSPYDHTSPAYADEKAYDDYFVTQVSELLEPYGPIDILWFDGCGSEGHTYDWERILGEIRRMQPDILLFNMGDPDFRWVGNEAGLADRCNRNTAEYVPFSVRSDEPEALSRRWLPAECDCRMRDSNWFFSDQDEDTVKSLEELIGLYHYACGRGANLLINIGPDRRGLLPDRDAERLVELGQEIERCFGSPLATLEDCVREGDTWRYETSAPYALIDHVIVGEDVARGEHIERFAIRATPWRSGPPITLYDGCTVGYQRICRFPLVRTNRIWLEVLEADGEVTLDRLTFHSVETHAWRI